MAGRESVRPRPAREVRSWDIEADVVVVGGGGAGTAAAIEAAGRGAETLILERTGGPGGASYLSGGYVYAGGGTSLQKACGFEDTPENMYNFLLAATGPNPNEAKLRVYCDESVAFFDWLVSMGIRYEPKFFAEPTKQLPGTHCLVYSGGENAYPWNQVASPAPRGHVAYLPQGYDVLKGEAGPGGVVLTHLMAAADKLGVKHECDARADRLVEADDGQIVGVIARRFGADFAVRARRGVVLAAGGFGADEEMMRHHAPHAIGASLIGTDGDDGRAIRMAQAAGAEVQLMDRVECGFPADARLLVRSVIVNQQGQRFINEDTYPGRIAQTIMMTLNCRAFIVFDQETFDGVPVDNPAFALPPTWVAETVRELEQQAGIPEGALQASVAYYNKHAAGGLDPQFFKGAECLAPLKPPFGAIAVRPESFAFFTLGGLVTAPSGAVLDVSGDPVPGLFAAGRTVSGVPAAGYVSGSSLGDSIFFGRKAGISAAGARLP
jgi:3-oxo-5alpha-steroid 4-dehydrogenase